MIKLNSVTFGFIFLCCLYTGLADDTFYEEFKSRIESLERQGQEQGKILIQQAEVLSELQTLVKEQNTRILSQEKTINYCKQRVQKLELTLAVTAKRKDKQNDVQNDTHHQEPISDPYNQYKEMHPTSHVPGYSSNQLKAASKRNGIRQDRSIPQTEGPVAFHAVVRADIEVSHIGINQNIVFPYVLTNLGGGYHNQHGLFTAPVAGVYMFSTSIMSYATVHVEIWVHLIKNGNILANAYAHGDSGRHDQGTVTVVTQLALGDEVWVSNYGLADTSIWGSNFDSFMGCLIAPL